MAYKSAKVLLMDGSHIDPMNGIKHDCGTDSYIKIFENKQNRI